MPCLLLFGPSGMGKTRIVQKFLREHRSSFDDVTGRTRLPIVAVQMPPAPSVRDLYEELLISMGAVLPSHQGVTTLRQRTRITARQLQVRMLVIDEIHSILAGTFREQRIVTC
jgi:replication-associated recombination protein RarA